jgi:hypothetical protein
VKIIILFLILLGGGFVGLCLGMWRGDRHSSWLDFGTPVLLYGLFGALLGVVAGAVLGVVLMA